MSGHPECQCPPKPYWSLGSMASGSLTEGRREMQWEAEHGHHSNAEQARLAGMGPFGSGESIQAAYAATEGA